MYLLTVLKTQLFCDRKSLGSRLTKGVRLDLSLNFDQVWKASWTSPKKVLNRTIETSCPSIVLRGKREKLWHELQQLHVNRGDTSWEAKRRRIKGRSGHTCGKQISNNAYKGTSECFLGFPPRPPNICVYIYIYVGL